MSGRGDNIHEAVKRCDLEAVRHFLEVEGVDIDCRRDGRTPLLDAAGGPGADEDSVKVIAYLVSKNANVEVTANYH